MAMTDEQCAEQLVDAWVYRRDARDGYENMEKRIKEFRASVLKECEKNWLGACIDIAGLDTGLRVRDLVLKRSAIIGNHVTNAGKIADPLPLDVILDARQEKLHEDLPGRRSVKAVIKDEPPYYETICGMLGCSGLDDKCPGNKECSILRKITKRSSSPCPTCAESVDGAPGGACCGQCREEDER